MILLKIGLIFLLITLLLRLKINFSISILLTGLILGIGFRLGLAEIGQSALNTLQEPSTLSLAGIVGLILVLSELLQASGQLQSLSELVRDTIGFHRITYTIMPALLGLLPMPGGALFSAPLLDNVSNELVPAHKKTLINYWFRHIWEYFWPLYPALVLAAGLTHIDFWTLCLYQSPMTVVSIISGMIFILPGIKTPEKSGQAGKGNFQDFINIIYLVLPIIIIIILFSAAKFPMHICLLCGLGWVIINIIIFRQLKIMEILRTIFLKKSVYKMILIALSVLVFTGIMRATTLTEELGEFFGNGNGGQMPIGYVIITTTILPLIVGMLTGMTIAYVGITFPLIFGGFGLTGTEAIPYAILAYVSGLSGVMLSPLHLCLILTNQYYGSSLSKVYRYLIPIVLGVLVAAFGIFWVYYLI